ncbi:MAG: hypothetical protein FVQ83_10210 [Chloroflexi bacterium]|nr:hypothetical protein [Chloroflexota bacterium]
MKANEYILSKQIQWARNNGIKLIGSKGKRGRPAYTESLNNNLFQPLTDETFHAFKKGDGGELTGNPSKMQAVHSSSALGVNIFQYWDNIKEVDKIAYACKLCNKTTKISKSITFEVKYPIADQFRFSPNIDAVIMNDPASKYKVFAVECKFTEAYGGRGHTGIKEKYLEVDIWEEIPHLHKMAISISPNDDRFQHLHAAQLIKHILGLKREYGITNFRLLYLWYDTLGGEGGKHNDEIIEFLEVAKSDNIMMHEISYQELILRMADNYRYTHNDYIEYISNRYL